MGQPLDKSYDSMESNEKDPIHYNFDSDNEPPHDEVGDFLTVVKKGQVTKTILEVCNVIKCDFFKGRRWTWETRETL